MWILRNQFVYCFFFIILSSVAGFVVDPTVSQEVKNYRALSAASGSLNFAYKDLFAIVGPLSKEAQLLYAAEWQEVKKGCEVLSKKIRGIMPILESHLAHATQATARCLWQHNELQRLFLTYVQQYRTDPIPFAAALYALSHQAEHYMQEWSQMAIEKSPDFFPVEEEFEQLLYKWKEELGAWYLYNLEWSPAVVAPYLQLIEARSYYLQLGMGAVLDRERLPQEITKLRTAIAALKSLRMSILFAFPQDYAQKNVQETQQIGETTPLMSVPLVTYDAIPSEREISVGAFNALQAACCSLDLSGVSLQGLVGGKGSAKLWEHIELLWNLYWQKIQYIAVPLKKRLAYDCSIQTAIIIEQFYYHQLFFLTAALRYAKDPVQLLVFAQTLIRETEEWLREFTKIQSGPIHPFYCPSTELCQGLQMCQLELVHWSHGSCTVTAAALHAYQEMLRIKIIYLSAGMVRRTMEKSESLWLTQRIVRAAKRLALIRIAAK